MRLLDRWRIREIDAEPKEESERLWANWERVRVGVEGFPQRTNTEDTSGDAEYVVAIDWRRGIRSSEYPFISTVIWSHRSVRGSR